MWSLKKSHVKYQVVGDGIGMHDDMGVKFFENFGHRKFTGKFPVHFLVPVLGCLCTQENFSMEFGCSENSWEMLDQ